VGSLTQGHFNPVPGRKAADVQSPYNLPRGHEFRGNRAP